MENLIYGTPFELGNREMKMKVRHRSVQYRLIIVSDVSFLHHTIDAALSLDISPRVFNIWQATRNTFLAFFSIVWMGFKVLGIIELF